MKINLIDLIDLIDLNNDQNPKSQIINQKYMDPNLIIEEKDAHIKTENFSVFYGNNEAVKKINMNEDIPEYEETENK